jgi:ACS family D-galactonate transporter-like MFS transporter
LHISSQKDDQERLPVASWRVLALLAFSVFINFVDRGNLSIAAPLLKTEFHLSASQLGVLLSSFFWTYTLCQLPVGWLIDRFDVTWILAIGFFLWSTATTISGLLNGFAALLVMRLILGIGESVAYPAYGKILAQHFPEHYRGTANAVISAAQASGPAFATFAGGIVINRFGWRPFFVFLGLASLLWLLPWFRWRPREAAGAVSQPKFHEPLAGVLAVLKQRSAWGTCLGLFSANYLLYILVTWLPFYLVQERHFSLTSTGKIAGAAFLLKAVGALSSGRISDFWISSGATPTLVRKTFICGGLTLAGILLVFSALAPTNLCIILLLAASFSGGTAGGHIWAASQTLAGPRLAGTWTGLQTFVGNFAGILAPAITGFVVDRTGKFLWAFVITAMVGWVGTLSWLVVVGPIRQVAWTQLRPSETSE